MAGVVAWTSCVDDADADEAAAVAVVSVVGAAGADTPGGAVGGVQEDASGTLAACTEAAFMTCNVPWLGTALSCALAPSVPAGALLPSLPSALTGGLDVGGLRGRGGGCDFLATPPAFPASAFAGFTVVSSGPQMGEIKMR